MKNKKNIHPLLQYRQEHNLTQLQLAKMCNTQDERICYLENNGRSFSLSNMLGLYQHYKDYNKSLAEFFGLLAALFEHEIKRLKYARNK